MLRCCACTLSPSLYVTIEELEVHIAADHVNYVPYECEKCRFSKFPTEFALVSHCMNDHGLREFYVKYKVTPETEKKRNLVKELLQKSLLISGGNEANRPNKRKRQCAVEVVHSSTSALSPCSSLESEENPPPNEAEKPVKCEFDKEETCDNDTDLIDRTEGQHVVVAASGEITLASNNYPVIASVGELFPNSSGPIFDFGIKNIDSLGDLSHTFLSPEGSSQTVNKTRRRPPRTCTICGLQVTGQRSSLVYHANSK
uniref:C2H2-type domain-containing protein n=1 Tax=Syphacia muris TaxID=451379 RepID=A0A0N5B1G7_9BILA